MLELCDWAVTITLLLLALVTFWKISLKIQKISIVIQIGGALEILVPLIILNTDSDNTQIKVFVWDCGFSGNLFFFLHCTIQV